MDSTAKNKLEILTDRIDSTVSRMRSVEGLIRLSNEDVANQISQSLSRRIERYAEHLKQAIADPDDAQRKLLGLADALESEQSDYLAEYLQSAILDLRRKLVSPCWPGASVAQLREVDELLATSKEDRHSVTSREKLDRLLNVVQRLHSVLKQLEQEKRVLRIKAPLRVIVWGIPVLIGVALSGKLGWNSLLLIAAILIILSAVSFFVVGRRVSNEHARGYRFLMDLWHKDWVQVTLFFGAMIMIFGTIMVVGVTTDPKVYPPIVTIKDVGGRSGELITVEARVAPAKSSMPVYHVVGTVTSAILKYTARSEELNSVTTADVPLYIKMPITDDVPSGKYLAELTTEYDTRDSQQAS